MLIIGVRNKKLDIRNISDVCSFCRVTNTLEITLYQQYVSIFWIPFFPSKKQLITSCKHCDATFQSEYMSLKFRQICEDIKTENKTPWWVFSGSGILVASLIALVIGIKIDTDNTREFVSAPRINDIFEIRLKDDIYTLYKVHKVEHDSVYFYANKYQISDETGISNLYDEEFETSKMYGLSISKFIQMNKDGEIIGAKRQ